MLFPHLWSNAGLSQRRSVFFRRLAPAHGYEALDLAMPLVNFTHRFLAKASTKNQNAAPSHRLSMKIKCTPQGCGMNADIPQRGLCLPKLRTYRITSPVQVSTMKAPAIGITEKTRRATIPIMRKVNGVVLPISFAPKVPSLISISIHS
jgi:hypothetical protein